MKAAGAGAESRRSAREREHELFRLTARTTLDTEAPARLHDLLSGPIDWDYVLFRGGLHGILPLMQRHIGEDPRVPEVVRTELRSRCERVVRYNLYRSSQLLELVGRLEAAEIPSIVLKGPAVACSVYGGVALREFGDLDLLVRAEDVPRATREVTRLGFEPWQEVSGAQEDVLSHVEYSRTFTRPRDALDLDLHWDLARTYVRGRIEAEKLWESRSAFELNGRRVPCLQPDLQLLALCVHGAKHGPFPWPRMKWICDVAELTRRHQGLDWNGTLERGRELGCYRTALFGLAVARPLIGPRMPAAVERALARQPELEGWARKVWEWLESDDPVGLSFGERAALDLALIDGWRGRLSYAARRLVTPTRKDWGRRRLPRGLAILYVPLRVLRLAGQYVPRPWRLRRLVRSGEDRPHSRADS